MVKYHCSNLTEKVWRKALQSIAIWERNFVRKSQICRNFVGLYGSDDWEGAKIDEIILKINEELEKIVPVVRETDKKKQV